MTRQTGAAMRAKLAAMVARLEQDPKADPAVLAKARKAIADYDALSDRLKAQV